MENNKFKIYYDDQPFDIISDISSILKSFGVKIKCVGDGDGYVEYKITKIDDKLEYSWVTIINEDYDTYPKEGYDVLVSDGIYYDVAFYIMSGEYKWLKSNALKFDTNLFTSFIPTKWKYINK